MKAMNFIVFSDDWGVHPSSCQHIFRHIIGSHAVSWINTVGMRPPRLQPGDLAKIVSKGRRMLSGNRQTSAKHENPSVYQPFMLPSMSTSVARKINRYLVARTMRAIESRMPHGKTVVVSTVPNAADYVDLIPADCIVYYCVDDFSEWPGLDRELILSLESDLLDKVNLVFATSEPLQRRLSQSGKPVELLLHGVDLDHFSRIPPSEHDVLKNIASPRVGFFGLIDGRMDQEVVRTLASALPDVSFVFAGPTEIDVADMQRPGNVHFVGRLPYDNLPEFIAGVDVLIVPYKVNALSTALSPLKLKEYLATGKPVVSSPITAALNYKGPVEIAETPTMWQEIVSRLIEKPGARPVENILVDLARDSWEHKAEILVKLCAAYSAQ